MGVRMLGAGFSLLFTVTCIDEPLCKIFELITGRGLFKYKPDLKYNLDEPNFMLYQMICYTGEDFRAEQLSVSPLAAQFFDSTCACATS